MLKAPWNPDDPITTLWDRAVVHTCQDFARDTIEPLTEAMIILHVIEALTASGVMAQYINEWEQFDFTLHFCRADKVRRKETTPRHAGFQNANLLAPIVAVSHAPVHAIPPLLPPTPRSISTILSPCHIVGPTGMEKIWTIVVRPVRGQDQGISTMQPSCT